MRKTFTLLTIGLTLGAAALAQEPADVLRASFTVPKGTARQQSIGGAMGSLGGDITTLYVNPAGLGFYNTGDAVLSAAYNSQRNTATYFNRDAKEKNSRIDFGASGAVIPIGHRQRSAAVAIGFNTTGDFRQQLEYRGQNNTNSYSQLYLQELSRNGVRDGNSAANDFPFTSSLALNTFYIDTVGGSSNGNFTFQSRAANILGTGLIQEQALRQRGGIYETNIGVGGQISKKWMVGLSVGLPYLWYRRESTFTEADATANGANKFDFAEVQESITQQGLGFNLRLGAIYKPAEFWRLGLAVHSPTWYSLNDRYTASITTDTETSGGFQTQSSSDLVGEDGDFDYTMLTPWRAVGSVSFVIRETGNVPRQRGFLTADVEYVHYPGGAFKRPRDENGEPIGEKSYFNSLNDAVDNAYQGAFNFRAGGELKFTKFMLRLGGAYYGNPYENINGEDASRLQLTGGLGYRHKGFFIDAAYVHTRTEDVHAPYRLSGTESPLAAINSRGGTGVLTFGVKF